MKKIKGNLNLIIGIITFLFIGFIIYNSFIKEDEKAGMEEISVGAGDRETKKIIEVLEKIDDIKIDSAFFNEKPGKEGYTLTFGELEDFSQPIPNKRPGKVNPFIKGGAIEYIDEVDKEDEEKINNDDQVVQEEIVQETND